MFEIELIPAVMKASDRISGKRFQIFTSFFFWNFLEIVENFPRDMVDQNTDDWVGKIFFFSQMFFILISISSFVFGTVTKIQNKINSQAVGLDSCFQSALKSILKGTLVLNRLHDFSLLSSN